MRDLTEVEVRAGVALLAIILPPFRRSTPAAGQAALAADVRRRVETLEADLRAAVRRADLALELAEIVDGWQRSADDPRAAITTLARMLRALRSAALTVGETASEKRARALEDVLATLVEGLALAATVRLLARVVLVTRTEADNLRAALVPAFDAAIDRASHAGAHEAVRALRQALGIVVRDLIERGRPLSQIVTYRTGAPLPACVLAHLLYADAGRASELKAENSGHHPAFMPLVGRAMSR